jgi:hypothetical protein
VSTKRAGKNTNTVNLGSFGISFRMYPRLSGGLRGLAKQEFLVAFIGFLHRKWSMKLATITYMPLPIYRHDQPTVHRREKTSATDTALFNNQIHSKQPA